MSIEVKVPKEITEYQEKILLGLSKRQLFCATLGVLTGIGLYFLCHKIGVPNDFIFYIIMFVSLPIMAIGFIRIDRQPLERFLPIVIRHFFNQNKRPYETNLQRKLDVVDKLSNYDKEPVVTTETTEKDKKDTKQTVKMKTKERKQNKNEIKPEECTYRCFKTQKELEAKKYVAISEVKAAFQKH